MTDIVNLDAFTVPAVSSASYPVRAGNRLYPLIDGEPAFRRVCEAIEMATHRVWATVTFMWATCQLPDGRGTPLDFLNQAAARGVDVRVLFWRPDPETEHLKTNAFWGSPDHFDQLRARLSQLRIRWDRAQPGYCQHQKSWLIDAGSEGEVAFVGGINLNPHSVVAPGHGGKGENHDVYVELQGPSAVDIHHNFVQRWNEASERHLREGRWGAGSETDLPFPTRIPDRKGDAVVQIQRTIHRGRYANGQATPQGVDFDIAAGESSNFDQYCAAIDASRRSIYIENQYIVVPEIIHALRRALQRGVNVVALLPAEGDIPDELASLGSFENFVLAGIAGVDSEGQRNPVWIHAKLMLVDGEWGTVGSCNLHRYSLFGNGEMNAAFWDQTMAHRLLSELLHEHLDQELAELDDCAALQRFGEVARNNRELLDVGDNRWQGLAYSLLPLRPHHS